MNENVYVRLRKFLDELPGGFPSTESGVEIKILKWLFTPEEARLTLNLTEEPEEVSALAKRAGMDESLAAGMLESMARQGSIFRLRSGKKEFYHANQFVIGIYEFHQNTLDREFAELMEEYMPHLGMVWVTTKTKQLRIVPVDSAVGSSPTVAPYHRIRELVRQQELIAMAPCICRKEQALLGNECDRPRDLCFPFGDLARYYIDNEMGRQITAAEALRLLDLAEESALVLSPSNSQTLEYMCCCCSCCCGVLRGLKLFDRPADHVQSGYQARIDSERCSDCGVCLERCQVEAIEAAGESLEVNQARCIGCGLCLSACPDEAIAFLEVPTAEAPPADLEEMRTRIRQERGLL
jgi:NAD-dependent dihydropyrimidine dehydrogenase PreA subunit